MSLIIFLLLIFFLEEIRTQNQIFITLVSKDNHLLFCDDNINNYGTSNINIYQLLEDKKININQKLILQEDDTNTICKKKIYYSTANEFEKILIEFVKFPTNLNNLFRDSTINSIEIISNMENQNNNEIIDFSHMFQDCKNITSIDLSNYNFCNAGKFNNMFSGCINLEFFILPQNLSIDCINYENLDFSEMFSNCISLTSIDLSVIKFNGINNINNIFLNCDNIQSIKLKGKLNIKKQNCIIINGKEYCVDIQNLHIEIFPKKNKLRNLDLYDINIPLDLIDMDNLSDLEKCLFYEYSYNIRKCSKYIGFHFCGDCINENIEEYCTKMIDGKTYNFYYLKHQMNIPHEKRNVIV